MKKLNKNEQGFGAVEGLLVLVIVVLIGVVGWFVYKNHNKTTANNTTTATTAPTTNPAKQTTKKAEYKLPGGYVLYNNDKLGFSFAYPQEWGELSAPTDPNLGYTASTKYFDNKAIGDSWLQGYFGFSVDAANTFKISTKKYGATVSPTKTASGYVWKVVEVNPADTTDKVGDTYTVKTLSSTSGVTLYDFTWQDEGATHSTWVFETNGQFVTMSLPAILRQFMDNVSAKDMDLYNSLAKNIKDSVGLN